LHSDDGKTPLHYALTEQVELEVVTVILRACPVAASTADEVWRWGGVG